MTTTKRPILATYTRQLLICVYYQLFHCVSCDSRHAPNPRALKQWLGIVEKYEVADALSLLGREYGYSKLNTFGKIARSSNPLTEGEKAFNWVARQPDKLALLQSFNAILRSYGHSWPLADAILSTGACHFELYMVKPKIKEAHDHILNALQDGPVTLNPLKETVGDCRKYILQLRALGHEIHMRPYWNKATNETHTQFYLIK